MRRRGYTLLELVMALVLMGIVTAAAVRTLIRTRAFIELHAARSDVTNTLRSTVAIVSGELRELSGAAAPDGDLLDRGPTALTYRAMRSVSFLCQVPDPTNATLTLWADTRLGLRPLEAGRDSLLVWADNDPMSATDDVWLHGAALAVAVAAGSCPGGADGTRVRVSGVTAAELAGVPRGAPVRGFQPARLLLYRGARGRSWLGMREWKQATGWSVSQPVTGPLAAAGLRFEYLGAGGASAGASGAVARLAVTVVGESDRPLSMLRRFLHDSVTFVVSPRNGPVR